MTIQLVGVDCAAQERNVGVAWMRDGVVREVASGLRDPARWIAERVEWSKPVLLALDAPLGWPAALGRALSGHGPGDVLEVEPNVLFRRRTDRDVRERTGKVPLDVGADRIARAAHGALRLLARVRQRAGRPLPLLWDPADAASSGVVEVYPAATLRSWGLPDRGYKGKTAAEAATRRAILEGLAARFPLADPGSAADDADALDAVVCLLAALDFLQGRCPPAPDHPDVREREGRIWVRSG